MDDARWAGGTSLLASKTRDLHRRGQLLSQLTIGLEAKMLRPLAESDESVSEVHVAQDARRHEQASKHLLSALPKFSPSPAAFNSSALLWQHIACLTAVQRALQHCSSSTRSGPPRTKRKSWDNTERQKPSHTRHRKTCELVGHPNLSSDRCHGCQSRTFCTGHNS